MKLKEPKVHRWTRDEYYKMGDMGLFDGKRVELIEGKIFEMGPQLSQRAALVGVVSDVLEEVFGEGYCARTQVPLDLGGTSDPEPDVAIVTGEHGGYLDAHPTTAHLIVEIADSSLSYDRTHKASLYAKAGIADYWIVNLIDRQLEIYRNPASDDAPPYGFGYSNITILRETDSVSPLAAPQAAIAVADLLP
jgi:Uma2 family endonuclease